MNIDFHAHAIANLIFGDRKDHEDFVQQSSTKNFKPFEENANSRMDVINDRIKEILKSPELTRVIENSSLAIYNIATKTTIEEFLLDKSINEVQRYFGCRLMLSSWTSCNGMTFDHIRYMAEHSGPDLEPFVFYKTLQHKLNFFSSLFIYLKNQITKEDVLNLIFGDINSHHFYENSDLAEDLHPFTNTRLDNLREICGKLFKDGAFVDFDLTDNVLKTGIGISVSNESLILAAQDAAFTHSEKAKLLFICCYIATESWVNKTGSKFQFLLDSVKKENEVVTAKEQKKFFWDLAFLITTFK